jgi:isopenicillin N synthase-like dioxygenase
LGFRRLLNIPGSGVKSFSPDLVIIGISNSDWPVTPVKIQMDKVAVVDLSNFLKDDTSASTECKEVVRSFYETGILIIKDPRLDYNENEVFIDMMERYYAQPDEVKAKDARPDLAFQVGSTPEGNEFPRDNSETIKKYTQENLPVTPKDYDHKWRFFWRAGERPKETKFKELNATQVIPEGFPEWEGVMNGWAKSMLTSVTTVAEMLAVGFGWKKDTLSSLMHNGPHLLAPTGSDLGRYTELKTVMAGFHYDLNLITIHGKSRYPGLYVWLRDGTKILVKVPPGCLLLQAGKQLEYLTGGYIHCGFHEVVVSSETAEAVKKAKENGKILWRVSSTLFSHVASDQKLRPLNEFDTKEANEKYPEMYCGDFVTNELRQIRLQRK